MKDSKSVGCYLITAQWSLDQQLAFIRALMRQDRAGGRAGGRGEEIRKVYCFWSPAASRALSWRLLLRGSRWPAAWLQAISRFG